MPSTVGSRYLLKGTLGIGHPTLDTVEKAGSYSYIEALVDLSPAFSDTLPRSKFVLNFSALA